MANKIQVKRGLKAQLPTLAVGEPALTTDTKDVFIGHTDGNLELATMLDIGDMSTIPTTSKTLVGAITELHTAIMTDRTRIYAGSIASQIISANVTTKIIMPVALTDKLNEYSTTLYRFTAKFAGTYHIDGSVLGASGFAVGMNYRISIFKNGASFHAPTSVGGTSYAATKIPFVDAIDLLVNDYVEFYITSSAELTLGAGSYINIVRIA